MKAARETETAGAGSCELKKGKRKGGAKDGKGKMAECGAYRFRHRDDGFRNPQDRERTVMVGGPL